MFQKGSGVRLDIPPSSLLKFLSTVRDHLPVEVIVFCSGKFRERCELNAVRPSTRRTGGPRSLPKSQKANFSVQLVEQFNEINKILEWLKKRLICAVTQLTKSETKIENLVPLCHLIEPSTNPHLSDLCSGTWICSTGWFV